MTKELIIIALIMVIVYLIYQQNNNQATQIIESPNIQQLRSELNHYQTLYQQRLEKEIDDSEKVKELTEQLELAEGIINKPVLEIATQTDLAEENMIALYKQVEYYQELSEQKEKTSQEQLRKINLLFDWNANSYPTIDFNGLYSLLQGIAEREREREQI